MFQIIKPLLTDCFDLTNTFPKTRADEIRIKLGIEYFFISNNKLLNFAIQLRIGTVAANYKAMELQKNTFPLIHR